MLELAVAVAFVSAAIILLVLAMSAGESDGVNLPRPSDENWRHW